MKPRRIHTSSLGRAHTKPIRSRVKVPEKLRSAYNKQEGRGGPYPQILLLAHKRGAAAAAVGPRVLTGAADIYQEQAPVERRGGLRSAEKSARLCFGGLGTNGGGYDFSQVGILAGVMRSEGTAPPWHPVSCAPCAKREIHLCSRLNGTPLRQHVGFESLIRLKEQLSPVIISLPLSLHRRRIKEENRSALVGDHVTDYRGPPFRLDIRPVVNLASVDLPLESLLFYLQGGERRRDGRARAEAGSRILLCLLRDDPAESWDAEDACREDRDQERMMAGYQATHPAESNEV
ncbi:hypothetical protein CEXT_87501 [Caerostris extrusa]|uniref:Uncharacterized protein n=1 Tax=Caerostris extrusa TaxID=172846 RepID=A0AAV4Y4R1_CAEEX|nr:hypothetical protein CEXT_87501 [Caerostris extrusa]